MRNALTLAYHWLALLIELDQVIALDQLGRERARHEEVLRIVGMTHADVAISVDHVFV